MNTPAPIEKKAATSNSQIVARNSLAYGIEMAYGIFATFATSIAMARVIGPEKLGYFNYILWLTNLSMVVGSLGVALTARKYMAEYLGRGEHGLVRSIFFAAFRLQALMGVTVAAAGLLMVFTLADPAQRTVSAWQVMGVLPLMLLAIPSQANMAAENLMANVWGSLVGQTCYIVGVILSLLAGWSVLGIAIAMLVCRSAEFLVRIVLVLRWIRRAPAVPLTPELKDKMKSFSGRSLILLVLNMVIWDRSDMIFLKWLNTDVAQISFFSAGFGLAEKVLLIPQVFNVALGATLMAQYGRDKNRLPLMLSIMLRYILLFVFPLLLGMAVLSPAIIPVVFGPRYLPAIPVLAVAAALALPKALVQPPNQALQASEQLGFLIWWSCFCGAVNIALDVLLIPRYAAVGAAWANGVAQGLAAAGIWWRARQVLVLSIDLRETGKAVGCGLTMAGVVWAATARLSPWPAISVGIPLGAAVLLLALRVTHALNNADRLRLQQFDRRLPHVIRRVYDAILSFLIPADAPVTIP